jgi:hypothetical protein
MRGLRRTVTNGALASLAVVAVAAALLGLPAAASAALPDLEIISVTPSQTTVPIGIPTRVTFVLNVRNDGEETTATNTGIGPVGGAPTFTNTDLTSQYPATCDPPGGDAPRCHVAFFQRPHTWLVEVTDTVLATTAGPVTRDFTADVLAPDRDGNRANNGASSTLQAVPGALPTISEVAVRPAGALTARQRGHAVGKLLLTLDRAAALTVTVDRRDRHGRYGRWGAMSRGGLEGANSLLLPTRVTRKDAAPINVTLNRMSPGTYRLTIVADDGGHQSAPVRRTFTIPRKR